VNDNQVDGMGDLIPPGEMNHVTRPGQNFGFPWYSGGKTRTNEYKDATMPDGVISRRWSRTPTRLISTCRSTPANSSPISTKEQFFSAQHGSWNRVNPVGARALFTSLKADGSAEETEVFAEGWLNENGEYIGRPVDVQVLNDGSLLVSDDVAGAVWRIFYSN
jgi:glucose/arabinose dehydrogenase